MPGSDPGHARSKALPSKPSPLLLWEIQKPAPAQVETRGHPLRLESAGATPWACEAASQLTTTYRNQGAIAAVLPTACAKGDRRPCSINSRQLGSQRQQSPGCALRAPRPCPAELQGGACERSGRSRANAPGLSAQKSPGSACQQERPSLLQLEAFVVRARPCAGPWGNRRTQSAAARRRKGGPRCRHPGPIGTPVLCTPQSSPARIWPNGDVGVGRGNATGPSSAVSRAGRNNQNKTLRLGSPALLEGRKPPFALTIAKGPGQRYAAGGLVVPRSEVGSGVAFYTRIDPGQAGGCLGHPPGFQGWACLNSLARGRGE